MRDPFPEITHCSPESAKFLTAAARAFFGSAWADQAEETGNSDVLVGQEILAIMPDEIDPAAVHAARTLLHDMVSAARPAHLVLGSNPLTCASYLVGRVKGVHARHGVDGDCAVTAENLGHYAAMQAMGHGVGLADAFGRAVYERIHVPYIEFGSHSLEKDYFEDRDNGND